MSPSATLALERRIVRLRFGGNVDRVPRGGRAGGGEHGRRARSHRRRAPLARRRLASRRARGVAARPAPLPRDVRCGRSRATSSCRRRRAGCPKDAGSRSPRRRPLRCFASERDDQPLLNTVEGTFRVEARGDVTALAAVPSAAARPAIVRELRAERRADAYADWTLKMQKGRREQARLRARPPARSSGWSTSPPTRRSSRSTSRRRRSGPPRVAASFERRSV